MRRYKMYIFFEDVELDVMSHALGDIQRVLLQRPHTSLEGVKQVEMLVWSLTVVTTPESMEGACRTMRSNLNIKNYCVS